MVIIDGARSEVGGTLRAVEQARDALASLEREEIPPPSLALERTEHPGDITRQIADGIAAARASVGYDKQLARLDAFEDAIQERAAELDAREERLGVVVEPRPLPVQLEREWKAFLEESQRAAAFTVLEQRAMREAAATQLDHWNPLARYMAERTEKAIVERQEMRECEATAGARIAFAAEVRPRIEQRFAEQSRQFAAWKEARVDL